MSALSSERWQVWSFSMRVPGVILTAGALLAPSVVGLRAGWPLLCGGVLLLEADMLRVYGHLRGTWTHRRATVEAVRDLW